MGAISSTSSLPILKKYIRDPERAVRETCEIALARIEWDNSEEGRRHQSAQATQLVPSYSFNAAFSVSYVDLRTYTSIDPAPPTSGLLAGKPKPEDLSEANITRLQSQLVDTKLPLFE